MTVDHEGNPDTQWWNSKKGEAAYIDFTNPAAADWYETRLRKLLADSGIDSYKFDAGESSWAPQVSKSCNYSKYPRNVQDRLELKHIE